MTEKRTRHEILRRRTILRRSLVGLAVFVLGAVAVAIPEVRLARTTKRARECLASYAEPRGPESPGCGWTIDQMVYTAYVPWTSHRARYRIEEIGVRIAHFEYVDAAVGKPNREALTNAVEGLEHYSAVVQNGSTRVDFLDLGPSVGAPDPGREADEIGDRKTLIDRGEQWFDWRVRLAALRAALLEADIDKAKALAKRYAVDDPHDPELRSAVGALLCMGPDIDKGSHFLVFLQDDRATRKYENLSRDYGEARSMLTSCLAKLDRPPPALPTSTQAGSADAVEQRALVRLRYANTLASDASQSMALGTVFRLLDGGPRNPGARLALLAALLGTNPDQDPARIVRFAKPKFDEQPLAPALTLTALEWVTDHRPPQGDADPAAILPGSMFVAAARAVEKLVATLDDVQDKPEENAANEVLKRELVAIRGAFLLEAAASLTRDGKTDEALQAAEDAVNTLHLNAHARSLLRSNVYWLSGDREKALAALEYDGGVIHTADLQNKHLLAALSMQNSELAMSLGKTDIARSSAHGAESYATEANDPNLFARARWMLAALGEIKAPEMLKEDLLTPLPFPSMGFAHPLEPWRHGSQDKQHALVEKALAPWASLSNADPTYRRAGRWGALRSHGDAPPWLSVHLLLAGRLLDPSEGDVEVWLDALMAMDQKRFSLRSYAFARAEAAHMRGDSAAAKMWDERFQTLRKLAAEVPNYELTRHLDI